MHFWSKKGKQSGESFGESIKPRCLNVKIPSQGHRNAEGAQLRPRFRGPRAAGPGAGGDLLCVCLKAFPPNRNKPLISLKGAEPRPCGAEPALAPRVLRGDGPGWPGWAGTGRDVPSRRSEPGNISFSARTLGSAGEERSSRLKPPLNFAA